MSSYLIDTHCHLHDQEWFTPEQAEDFLQSAAANNVRQIIVIGTDPTDSAAAQAFAAAHPGVYWTYGIHPEHSSIFQSLTQEGQLMSITGISGGYDRGRNSATPATAGGRDCVSRDRHAAVPDSQAPIAIGEIGLDYHYDGYNRSAQLRLFEQMLQLARDLSLPISLHIRGHAAFADVWSVLDNFPELTGVVHSFTGSKQELKRALARDFFVGVNGLATYSTIALPPLEKMLLETDAPFLTPTPFRGTMNQPGYVCHIAAYLADKLGVAEATIAEQTTNNARELFKLGDSILPEGK